MSNLKSNTIIVFLVFLNFYQVLIGGSFLVEEDAYTLFTHTQGNVEGNGWRTDKGLGSSFFFGDPGAYHAWSLLTILNKIIDFSSDIFFNYSIIFFFITGTLSIYYFLININKNISNKIAIALALLIVCSPIRYELFFQRHWLPIITSLPIAVYHTKMFFEKENFKSLLYVTLSLFFTTYFGSIGALQNLLMGLLIFFILNCTYYKTFLPFFKKFIKLIVVSLTLNLLLGAWTWYSIIIEYINVDYIRSYSETFSFENLRFYFGGQDILRYLFSLFNSGIFSPLVKLPDSNLLPVSSIINVIPFFAIILLFYIFHKSKSYWEYIAKFSVLIYFVHLFFCIFFGDYKNLPIFFTNLYSWHKVYPEFYFFQIILLSFFINRIQEIKESKINTYKIFNNLFFISILIIHVLLLFFSIFSLYDISIIQNFASFLISKFFEILDLRFYIDQNEIILILNEIILRLSLSISFVSLIFYSSTILLLCIITSKLTVEKNFQDMTLTILFIICATSMAWVCYPMSKNENIWENYNINNNEFQLERFAYIDLSVKDINKKNKETSLIKLWKDNSLKNKKVGYLSSPGLSFSGVLSHWPEKTANYLYGEILKDDNYELRDLSNGDKKIVNNYYLNFLGIKYLYFKNDPKLFYNMDAYEEVSKQKQLYIYENKNSLPHYYLAKNIFLKNQFDIKQIKIGDIFLKKEKYKQYQGIFTNNHKGKLNLLNFKNGYYEFEYSSYSDNLMIINDSWHPNWKAEIYFNKKNKINGNSELEIFLANQIYKGIHLPKGSYKFKVFFDTKKYNLGIYISITLFLILIIIILLYRKKIFYEKS